MGHTPTVQLSLGKNSGRDHHHDGFTVWLAGGGVKGGHVHGTTDVQCNVVREILA